MSLNCNCHCGFEFDEVLTLNNPKIFHGSFNYFDKNDLFLQKKP